MAAQALINKRDGLTNTEFITKMAITYFNMRKIKDEALEKIMTENV